MVLRRVGDPSRIFFQLDNRCKYLRARYCVDPGEHLGLLVSTPGMCSHHCTILWTWKKGLNSEREWPHEVQWHVAHQLTAFLNVCVSQEHLLDNTNPCPYNSAPGYVPRKEPNKNNANSFLL